MLELEFERTVEIVRVREHWEGYVDGEFVVSGDTYNEVCTELTEAGYL